MIINRRSAFLGLVSTLALGAGPAIVRASSLMPVRALWRLPKGRIADFVRDFGGVEGMHPGAAEANALAMRRINEWADQFARSNQEPMVVMMPGWYSFAPGSSIDLGMVALSEENARGTDVIFPRVATGYELRSKIEAISIL